MTGSPESKRAGGLDCNCELLEGPWDIQQDQWIGILLWVYGSGIILSQTATISIRTQPFGCMISKLVTTRFRTYIELGGGIAQLAQPSLLGRDTRAAIT